MRRCRFAPDRAKYLQLAIARPYKYLAMPFHTGFPQRDESGAVGFSRRLRFAAGPRRPPCGRPTADGWKRCYRLQAEREDPNARRSEAECVDLPPETRRNWLCRSRAGDRHSHTLSSNTWEPWATYFASHGYGFASIDVRGRGDSGGDFEPYVNEATDGHDAVEWLARQPFCDGHVGMWGGSYGGFNQWAVAREFPPHLKTIVPVAAAHPGVDVPFYNNIGQPYLIQWLASVSGDLLPGTRR